MCGRNERDFCYRLTNMHEAFVASHTCTFGSLCNRSQILFIEINICRNMVVCRDVLCVAYLSRAFVYSHY